MAKKILIVFVALFVCIASFKVLALDLKDDKEFEEVVTDQTFMLDSPLFTNVEKYEKNTKNYGVSGFTKVLENDKFIFYHICS